MWEGDGVVKSARKLIGSTNPLEAEPGTIRGDLAVQTGRNVVHGSDSPENGERETGADTLSEDCVFVCCRFHELVMHRLHVGTAVLDLYASTARCAVHASGGSIPCCQIGKPIAVPYGDVLTAMMHAL